LSAVNTLSDVLCAGLLKTLGANKNAPLPVHLFEVSDVMLLSDSAESGARNERRLAAAVCAKENTFETIHGVLNRVMDVLGVPAHVPGLGAGITLATLIHPLHA
jgi:phenylalanyl-tRNA synthetase beta chain